MKSLQCSEERFLKDVGQHEMTVLRDDGVHRHIRFRRPSGSSYWFDLITWPGSLCIDGDMGTYVFRRLDDMFEFFRTDREYLERKGMQLAINPGYWGEKLQAYPRKGYKEHSAESFRQHVKDAFDDWVLISRPDDGGETSQEERDAFAERKNELLDELEFRVLSAADDGETRCYDAAMDFTSDVAKEFSMQDCWEWDCKEYTFHFIWCCYAIAWSIKAYDTFKTTQKATS